MGIPRWVILTVLVCTLAVDSGCTPRSENHTQKTTDAVDKAVDETKEAGEEAADDTKNVVEEVGDKTKEVAGKTADKTKEIAGDIAEKSKDVVSATGEKITDGWITTKVSGKFSDETLLKDSKIDVDSKDHVVTLNGTVASNKAKARAVEIARGTEGVVRVIDKLVVNAR